MQIAINFLVKNLTENHYLLCVKDFYDVKGLQDEYHNFTADEHGEPVLNWMEVSVIQPEKSPPYILKFKRCFS